MKNGAQLPALGKKAFYKALKCAGTYRFARRRQRRAAVILTYHGVLGKATESYVNRNCVEVQVFEAQMQWLKRQYHVMSLSTLLEALEGKAPMPENAAAVTFDDGFRNNYTRAFPVLVRHGIPATIFLTTDFIGSRGKLLWTERVDSLIYGAVVPRLRIQMNGMAMEFRLGTLHDREVASDRIRKYLKSVNPAEREKHIDNLEAQVAQRAAYLPEFDDRYAFLDWQEVRKMSEAGIEFGSHTRSHAIVSTLAPGQLQTELRASKEKIEEELGLPCRLFSYPNGTAKDFTHRDQQALQRLGYRAALTQIHGFNVPGDNLYTLRRINIVRSADMAFFEAKVTGVWGQLKALARS